MLDYVRTWGDEDAPTVVLLHPAGGTRHSWTPHAEMLSDEYHVVAVDLPAHGLHPLQTFSFDRAVADVETVLEAVGSAVLVGHSQGGYVALRAAAAHAERVDGLLLAGAAYNWRTPKMLAMNAVYLPLMRLFRAASHSSRLTDWLTERFGEADDPRQAPPDDEARHNPLRGNAEAFRAAMFQRSWRHVEAYDGPVLVAHGESEPLGDHAETLAGRADARLAWYEGGHRAPMSNTTEFTDLVEAFLEDVYPERDRVASED